jgi:DNA-binding transcriptional MerR regulator
VVRLDTMELRIDELAQRSGVTSRNIRAYQARGLLPPPTLVGRTGFYGEEHLRRLEIITDLQERGFSLEAIRHTLDAWSHGGDLSHIVGVRGLLDAPFSAEQPARFGLDELLTRFPEAAEDPELIERAVKLGLVEVDGDEVTVPSPLLVEAGAQLVDAGVPLESVLDLVEGIRPRVAEIARGFVGIVAEHLVRPLLEGRVSGDEAGDVVEAVRRLRPVAMEVVRPFLAQEMSAAIDEAVREHGLALDPETAPPDRENVKIV